MSSDFSEILSSSSIDADQGNRTEINRADASKPNHSTNKADTDRLKQTIYDIDCIAQEGLENITAVCKLLLLAMESPRFYECPDDLQQALRQIRFTSQALETDINALAEQVGCNFSDSEDKYSQAVNDAFRASKVA